MANNADIPSRRAKVLLVDDQAANLLALRAIFDGDQLELDLIEASSGEEALRKLNDHEFAVVLLDVNMPTLDGFETAKLIREGVTKVRYTPIIFVTAQEIDAARVEMGYTLGATDFLTKPLKPSIVRAKVGGFADLFLQKELARHEADQLRLLIHGTQEYAIFLLDADGYVRSWNPGAARIKGFRAEEIIGQHFSRFYPPEAIERNWPAHELEVARATGRFEEEGWRVRKDGGHFWANVVLTALYDDAGNLRGFSKITKDLTLKREAEENERRLLREEAARRAAEEHSHVIQAQREQLRVTLASIGDAVISTDAAGMIVFLNIVAERLTGWNKEDATGLPLPEVFKIINEHTRQPVDNPAARALREGVIVGLANQTLLIARDGTELPIDDSAAPIHDDKGAVIGCALVFRDISERKRADELWRASEQSRKLALDSAEMGTWNIAPASNEMLSDDRFRVIVQGSSAPITYEQAVAAIHPADRERVQESVTAAIRPDTSAPFAEEYRVVHPDGSVHWVLAMGRANFVESGSERRLVSFNGVLSDVTQRKQLENDLRRMAADLSAADHRKDEFLATLAHELRNPLAPIRNGLQLIRLAAHDRTTVEQTGSMMERQLTQLVRLVDDLMDVSRITQGKLTLRMERIDLVKAVNSAVEASRLLIAEMGHELHVTLPTEPLAVQGDLTRLVQVFTNLLNNSAKYSERGGQIWLTVEPHGKEVRVSVKDRGIGIAADQLPRIFELFSQIDRSLEKSQGGLGIGLSLVKKLVEMHGGMIEAKSEGVGKGSEFVVRLPGISELSTRLEKTGANQAAVKAALRILIVDDNRDGANSLAMMLKVLGNETRTAFDGEEAVAVARDMLPDVILLDIGLPKLNGYEVCLRIRQQPGGKNIVIIAQTGWGQEEDRRRTQEVGFNHHFVKPVDPHELLTVLANLKPT